MTPHQRWVDALAIMDQSHVGIVLGAHGFKATDQGGGMLNYERVLPDGRRITIIEDSEGSGWGPSTLIEAIYVCTDVAPGETETEDVRYTSIPAYLATFQGNTHVA